MTGPVILKAAGNDWYVQRRYVSPTNVPIDLTSSVVGGYFYTPGRTRLELTEILSAGSGITVGTPRTSGTYNIRIDRSLTALIYPDIKTVTPSILLPAASSIPTRIEIFITNSLGNRETVEVIGVRTFNGETVDPSVFETDPDGNVVAPFEQGPPGRNADALNPPTADLRAAFDQLYPGGDQYILQNTSPGSQPYFAYTVKGQARTGGQAEQLITSYLQNQVGLSPSDASAALVAIRALAATLNL